MGELLSCPIPLPPWVAPRRRRRPPKRFQDPQPVPTSARFPVVLPSLTEQGRYSTINASLCGPVIFFRPPKEAVQELVQPLPFIFIARFSQLVRVCFGSPRPVFLGFFPYSTPVGSLSYDCQTCPRPLVSCSAIP